MVEKFESNKYKIFGFARFSKIKIVASLKFLCFSDLSCKIKTTLLRYFDIVAILNYHKLCSESYLTFWTLIHDVI